MEAYFYSETGFNTVDIPDSLELVKEHANQVFYKNNINLIQQDNILKLKVKGMIKNIARAVDYVIISDNDEESGYFVNDNGYEFVAPDTCTFYLILDPYATIGGLVLQNEIISGTANRMTISETEDDTEYFTLIEPFKPSLRNTILEAILDGRMRDPHEDINILETLVIPPKTMKDAETTTGYDTGRSYRGHTISMPSNATRVFESASLNQNVIQDEETIAGQRMITSTTVNDVQVIEYREMVETNLTIKGLFGDNKTIKTGSRWWKQDQLEGTCLINNQTKKTTVINDLRITGSDSNINNYWAIPAPYISSSSGSQYQPQEKNGYGGLDSISSSLHESSPSEIINADYTSFNLKNNKAKYGQGTKVIVFNPVNGNKLEKFWYEIIDKNIRPYQSIYQASFKIAADIRPEGFPIFAFKYINGKEGNVNPSLWGYCYSEILTGGNWRQIPISGQGTNSATSQLALNQQKDNTVFEAVGGALLSITQVISGGVMVATGVGSTVGAGLISSGVNSGISTLTNYVSNSNKQKDQQELLNAQGQVAGSSIKFSSSSFVRELGYNTFYVMYIMYSEEDLKAFDKFLTLYGYNVGNKKITTSDFNSRPGFNYIRINDIDIRSEKGLWLIERVKEQLKAGVRIWHEMPNTARISQGNKGAN